MTAAARQNMILSQLHTNDIVDARLLEVLASMPREPFLPEHLRGAAYVDEELEAAPERYLLAPLVFARLVELAQIAPESRVLVIGCLQGYATAVIAKLAANVVGTEVDAQMIEQARALTKRLAISNLALQQVASLAEGYAPSSPYDAIIICGAVNFIPEPLGAQLGIGGRLVTVRHISDRTDPNGGFGKGMLVERIDNKLQYREHFDASATVLPGFIRTAQFRF